MKSLSILKLACLFLINLIFLDVVQAADPTISLVNITQSSTTVPRGSSNNISATIRSNINSTISVGFQVFEANGKAAGQQFSIINLSANVPQAINYRWVAPVNASLGRHRIMFSVHTPDHRWANLYTSDSALNYSVVEPAAVAGVCGKAHNNSFTGIPKTALCEAGASSAVTGQGPWWWTCRSSGSLPVANCRADFRDSEIGIDFASASQARVNPEAFGVNIVPRVELTTAALQNVMRSMNFPFIRINGQDSLLGSVFYSRDAAEGRAEPDWRKVDYLTKVPEFYTGKIMLTIGGPPDPAHSKGWAQKPWDLLSPSDQALYASMAGRIVQRLKNAKVNISHFAALNESNIAWYKEGLYYRERMQATCNLEKQAVAAMKSVYPSAAFGGPELDYWRTNIEELRDFAACTKATSSFTSFHIYGVYTHEKYDVGSMFDAALGNTPNVRSAYQASSKNAAAVVRESIPNAALMMTEYNLNGAWSPSDPLHLREEGVVYNTLAITEAIRGGVSIATIWEAYDNGTFGLISKDFQIRPMGHALRQLREVLPGQLLKSSVTSTIPGTGQKIKLMATKNSSGGVSMVLINYSLREPYNVNLVVSGTTAKDYRSTEFSGASLSGRTSTVKAAQLTNLRIPANSVLILRSN